MKKCMFFLSVNIIVFLLSSCDNGNLKVTKKTDDSQAVSAPETLKNTVRSEITAKLRLATEFYASKQYDKAIDEFISIIEIDSTNISAIIGLGNVYYDTEQKKNAITFYEKALKIEPNNVNVRCDMATCYINLGEFEKSVEINRQNVEMDPNHIQSHHNLALVLEHLGRTEEAAKEKEIYHSLVSKPN